LCRGPVWDCWLLLDCWRTWLWIFDEISNDSKVVYWWHSSIFFSWNFNLHFGWVYTYSCAYLKMKR
jgi:hypothetical protein